MKVALWVVKKVVKSAAMLVPTLVEKLVAGLDFGRVE